MTYAILPVLGFTLSITALAGGVMAISAVLPEPEENRLNTTDITSLWTSRPVPVDPGKQNFERLPARPVQLPETADLQPATDKIVTGTIRRPESYSQPEFMEASTSENFSENVPSEAELEAVAWCTARYRSYRASDNTYQPYTGARRPCEPPLTISAPDEAVASLAELDNSLDQMDYAADSHAQWCLSRYRSYNPDSNTYRAFSGEIRSCVSPYI